MLFRNKTKKKDILEDLFRSVLSQFEKYHPPWNLKVHYFGIFQSLKLLISMLKNPFNFSQAKFHTKYFGLLRVKPNAVRHRVFSRVLGYFSELTVGIERPADAVGRKLSHAGQHDGHLGMHDHWASADESCVALSRADGRVCPLQPTASPDPRCTVGATASCTKKITCYWSHSVVDSCQSWFLH